MTIAAGFPCVGGLVLCADTQESIPGYVKINTGKMTSLESHLTNIVFTGAGDTELIEMTIQRMEQALSLNNYGSGAAWSIEQVLRDSLVDSFNQCVAPYASFPSGERPNADLLIGVQFGAATSLYRATGTTLRRVYEPEVVGAGVVLAKALTAQFFDQSMSLAQAGIVALYVLHQTKTWVDGCGGNSDILLLSNRDRTIARLPTSEISELEHHFDEFNTCVKPLFIAAADRSVPHSRLEVLMKQFRLDMLGLRGKFMEFEEFYRRLSDMTGVPFPPSEDSTPPEPSAPNSSQSQKP